jgi:dCMP deaminase
MNWDTYFLLICQAVALKSKDTSTKLGSVIVGPKHEIRSTGYNALPRGVGDDVLKFPERFERPEKYKWVVHAEKNAILNAARVGTATEGCSLYVSGHPCSDCTKAIINAGISRIVYNQTFQDAWPMAKAGGTWAEDFLLSDKMLSESGVDIFGYSI